MNDQSSSNAITCPQCGFRVPLTEALQKNMTEMVQAELKTQQDQLQVKLTRLQKEQEKQLETKLAALAERDQQLRSRELEIAQKSKEFENAVTAEVEKRFSLETKRLESKLKELQDRDVALRQREESLIIERESHEKYVEQKVSERVALAREKLAAEIQGGFNTQIIDLASQVTEQKMQIGQLQEKELEHLKEKRELEKERREIELQAQRRINEIQNVIRQEERKLVQDEFRSNEEQHAKLVSDLKRQIDDLRVKAEQGSQQMQGEVFELSIESLLRECFPTDTFQPVPTGKRGGDIIHTVIGPSGQVSGRIIWELKDVKNWKNDFVQKLKDDQLNCKADIAVIVSTVLPQGLSNVGDLNGVWVTTPAFAAGVGRILRAALIDVASAKMSAVGQDSKMRLLYEYLCSPPFRHKVGSILDAFATMRAELEKEKKAYTKIWARREQQIGKVEDSLPRIYGDLQGIIGASLPEISALSLPEPIDEPSVDQD